MAKQVFDRSIVAALVVGLLVAAVPSVGAGQRQPTSPDVKERMIQLIATLEADPYNEDAKAYRREVLDWLTNAPDVTVEVCANLLGDVRKLKGEDGDVLIGQLAMSEAKYILEHPDKAKDRLEVSVAGIDGVLRTYVAMKEKKPELKFEPLDMLLKAEADEKLEQYAEAALKHCK